MGGLKAVGFTRWSLTQNMLFKQVTLGMEARLSYTVSVARDLFTPTFQAKQRAAEKKDMLKESD